MKKIFLGTQVHFETHFPVAKILGANTVVFYDQKLLGQNGAIKKWLKQFDSKIAVQAGESLKSLASYEKALRQLVALTQNKATSDLTLVAVGGGSVGDFVGFVASTFKRGVRLVQVPTTWLAAIDSAHGGKTALNLGGFKNQIGTFHSAKQIWIIRDALRSQRQQQSDDGWAEIIKLGLLKRSLFVKVEKALRQEKMWELLPAVVAAKYQVVKQDPFEKIGQRRLLNLGHTIGHVLESHYQLSHGRAVAGGLLFAINWSYESGLMSAKAYWQCVESFSYQKLIQHFYQNTDFVKLSTAQLVKLLQQDKKKVAAQQLKFILLKRIGEPLICNVAIEDIANEYMRQVEHGTL